MYYIRKKNRRRIGLPEEWWRLQEEMRRLEKEDIVIGNTTTFNKNGNK